VVRDHSVTIKHAPNSAMAIPHFIDQHGSSEDKRLASEALRITREIRVLLSQLFVYVALTRSRDFADACSASDAAEGVNILISSRPSCPRDNAQLSAISIMLFPPHQ
jgi:hypothetical protein